MQVQKSQSSDMRWVREKKQQAQQEQQLSVLRKYTSCMTVVMTVALFLCVFILPPTEVSAQNCPQGQCIIDHYVNPAINILAALVGIGVTLSIIIGGIQYASSEDNAQKVAAAKEKIIKAVFVLVGFFVLYGFLNWAVPGGLAPAPAGANATQIQCGGGNFLSFPTWYKYICGRDAILAQQNTATPNAPNATTSDIPLIALAILEIALRIIALVAIAYVIIGGGRYVVSQGDSNKTAAAKSTIINALVGLLIATFAIAIVSFVGNRAG